MERMKIKFTKVAHGHTDADCTMCKHDSICSRRKAMDSLELPTPFAVYFDCEHWESEKD